MATWFWIGWTVNFLVFLVVLYEGLAVSSNRNLMPLILLLGAVVAMSWWWRHTHPRLALWLVGIPAGLLVLFVAINLLMLATGGGRNNWN